MAARSDTCLGVVQPDDGETIRVLGIQPSEQYRRQAADLVLLGHLFEDVAHLEFQLGELTLGPLAKCARGLKLLLLHILQ